MALISGYFVLPEEGSGTRDDPFRPKYTDYPSVEKYYGGEGIEYGDQTWIPTRVFVDEANAGDLDTLEAQSDVFRIYPAAIETALNDLGAFPVDLTARQWALLFSKFLMPE